MKHLIIFLFIIFSVLLICHNLDSEYNLAMLKGPYLGQKPPGIIPEIFAPGILCTGHSEIKAVFTPDGKELFYQLWGAPFPVIVTMKEKNGRWTQPKIAFFSGQVIEGYNISPDGKQMFVVSKRPFDGKGKPLEKSRVWISEKSDMEWGKLKVLKASIRGYPTIAANGNLYLATGDMWVSEYVNGEYTEMKKLGNAINTKEFWEEDPFVAPDESYLMFCRRDDGFGSWDIFISFRKADGSWTRAKNMGEKINTSASEVYPFVTADGKYFFFSSSRTIHRKYSQTPLTYKDKIRILNSPGNGNADIYWVDVKIIEELKPDEFK